MVLADGSETGLLRPICFLARFSTTGLRMLPKVRNMLA